MNGKTCGIGGSEILGVRRKTWRDGHFLRPRRMWEYRPTDIASLSKGAFTRSVVRCRIPM